MNGFLCDEHKDNVSNTTAAEPKKIDMDGRENSLACIMDVGIRWGKKEEPPFLGDVAWIEVEGGGVDDDSDEDPDEDRNALKNDGSLITFVV